MSYVVVFQLHVESGCDECTQERLDEVKEFELGVYFHEHNCFVASGCGNRVGLSLAVLV